MPYQYSDVSNNGESMEVTKEFKAPYEKKGKHRRRCKVCNRLMQDGEMAVFRQIKDRDYYPVSGVMGFTNWYVAHDECDKHKDDPPKYTGPKSPADEILEKAMSGELTAEEAVEELKVLNGTA
jgi:hypothetical protein